MRGKRIFDCIVAALGLFILLPLFILVGCAIYIDNPGPIFFGQVRIGFRGRPFRIFKFRTMYPDAEPYAETPKNDWDGRVTRIGRFLRKTGIDELPQLLNVLQGEMSLVGPRPEMPFIVAQYTSRERKRLDTLPGLTGIWQILAPKGKPIHHFLEYDLYYINNNSFMLDLWILVLTPLAILCNRVFGKDYQFGIPIASSVWPKFTRSSPRHVSL